MMVFPLGDFNFTHQIGSYPLRVEGGGREGTEQDGEN